MSKIQPSSDQILRSISGKPAALKSGAFDAKKEIARRAAEGAPVQRDVFAEALRESQDGDSDEGKLAGQLGLLPTSRRGEDKVLDRLRKANVDSSETSSDQDDRDAAPQDDSAETVVVGDTNTAKRVETANSIEKAQLSASTRHEKLMLASATMVRDQIATHVANEGARKIQKILARPLWERSHDTLHMLAAQQMMVKS